MKNIILPLLFAIVLTLDGVYGVIITGPMTSLDKLLKKIWLKGTGQMRNLLPDTTFNDNFRDRKPGPDAAVGRRFLTEVIAALRKQIQRDEELQQDEDERKEIEMTFIGEDKENMEDSLRSRESSRLFWSSDQAKKINEITIFLHNHYDHTNYVYEEIQRIKSTRKVKDTLRLMVEFLEQPKMEKLKQAVLKCFYEKKESYKPAYDPFNNNVPNTLVIDSFGDPYKYNK